MEMLWTYCQKFLGSSLERENRGSWQILVFPRSLKQNFGVAPSLCQAFPFQHSSILVPFYSIKFIFTDDPVLNLSLHISKIPLHLFLLSGRFISVFAD
jgi:hypothetical protein